MKLGLHLGRCAVVGTVLTIGTHARSCGLDWIKPATHFDGMDDQGHVMFVDTLGNLTLKDGTVVPLYTMFKSSWMNSSPYLGQGWMLPLLDAHIAQINDNTFRMWQPDGWYHDLYRGTPTDTVLNGQAGWKAVINGDTITVWASCGWKMTYEKGKITSIMTPKNDVLEMIYRNGQVAEVQENGLPIMSVDVNANTGMVDGLIVNGKRLDLQESNKPLVQVVAGKNVVGQVSPSLSKVTLPDGTSKNYKFTVDDKLEPLLITDNDTIQWDPATQLITKDKDWTYNIVPGANGPGEPQFTLTDTKGQQEYYYSNSSTGTTTAQGIDGVKQITTTFVNAGLLSGRVRNVTQIKNGVSTVLRRCDYDENGRLIRNFVLMGKPHVFIYKYGSNGRENEIDVDNKIWVTKQYDSQGRLVGKALADGVKIAYAYVDGGIQKTIFLKNGKTVVKNLNDKYQEIQNLETRETVKLGEISE